MSKISEFVDLVYPKALQIAKDRGYNVALAQTCVSQSALETGWHINPNTNALFGIKATKEWKGKVYNAKTKEVYDGVVVSITDCFRAYDTVDDSILDYFNLIANNSRYNGALKCYNVKDCITIIKNGGYATDPDYISKVLSVWGTIQGYITTKPVQAERVESLESMKFKVVHAPSGLNVRSSPSTNAPIKTVLKNDSVVDGEWLYLPKLNGYVNIQYVKRM